MYVLFALIGIALFLWAIHRAQITSWYDLWNKSKQLHVLWLVLSVLFSLLAYFPRALRWKLLLDASNAQVSTTRSYNTLMVGYLVNIAIPRGGELFRCLLLKKTTGTSMAQSLGTIITERALDIFCLILLIILTLSIEAQQLLHLLHTLNLFPQYHWLAILGYVIAGIATLFLLYTWSKKRRPTPLHLRIENFFKRTMKSIYSIKNIQYPIQFTLYTLLIWTLYYLSIFTLLLASTHTQDLDAFASLSILSASGIAISIPTPGGIGSYHLIVSAAIEAYHIPKDISFLLSTTIHLLNSILTAVIGISVLQYAMKKRP